MSHVTVYSLSGNLDQIKTGQTGFTLRELLFQPRFSPEDRFLTFSTIFIVCFWYPTWILGVAKEKNAGVIIMGSHGRTGLKTLLMGSVTERVMGYALRSVLVVPG